MNPFVPQPSSPTPCSWPDTLPVRRRRCGRLALTLVATLLLAGCEGHPAPAPAQKPSSTPASPTGKPPPLPTGPSAAAIPAGQEPPATPDPRVSASRIDDAEALLLLKRRQCSGCHQRDRKVVGPSWRQIGEVLAEQPDAPARLRHSIRNGSQRNWGPLSMPAQPQLTDAELDMLIPWILQTPP